MKGNGDGWTSTYLVVRGEGKKRLRRPTTIPAWETAEMGGLLVKADNCERTETLGRRETMEGLLFLIFNIVCLTHDLSYMALAILELVVWTKIAWNSRRSTQGLRSAACSPTLGYGNFYFELELRTLLSERVFDMSEALLSNFAFLTPLPSIDGFLVPSPWGQVWWFKSVIPAVGKERQ